MNMAAPAPADNLDRYKRDRMLRRKECHQHFGFDLEVFRFERQGRPGSQVDEPKTTLRVGQVFARAPRQLAAHPAVHLPAQPGNGARVVHAVAHDQQRPGLFGALQKGGHVIRRMLTITVKREGPFKALFPCLAQAGFERSTLAEVLRMPDHRRARGLGPDRGVIRRTIVHDQHEGEMFARCGDQGRNARALVETGDHHRAFRRFKHASSLG
jgi:hypothetical protein